MELFQACYLFGNNMLEILFICLLFRLNLKFVFRFLLSELFFSANVLTKRYLIVRFETELESFMGSKLWTDAG